jgi:aminoglycoside phosphotransferase family enzyme/predicted kinase
VRLNRRLAPDAYLGVVPVCETVGGQFTLGGEGGAVDWLVKMKRLDEARRLDVLLAQNALTSERLSELADHLANFYRNARVVAVSPAHYVARLVDHVLSNRAELLENMPPAAHAAVKRVHADQLQLLGVYGDYFHDRVCAGRVVDGHGDLRPEHVYLYTPPKIVDCIEFSDDYRTVDVADDLSFFAMECAALGKPEVGRQVLQECLTQIGDSLADGPRRELIEFYISYRACVRAKVALRGPATFTVDQAAGNRRPVLPGAGWAERALHYLHLAESHAASSASPWLIVVCGGVGTGKSTLARRLAETLGLPHLQTDVVRRELFGPAGAGAKLDQGVYSSANRLKVYQEMYQRAVRLLDEGIPVVLDGSFQQADAWRKLEQLLPHTRARVLAVLCRCSPELAHRRVEARIAGGASESDARPEMVHEAKAAPLEIPENILRVSVDTANSPDVLADCVFRRMRT